MDKKECINIFNAMIRGTPVPFDKKLLPMYIDYLTENNIENSEKLITLVVQNPQLLQRVIPKLIEYYCRKYNIFSITKLSGLNDLNIKQTLLYYE